jgi:hypothetical protein
MHHLVVKPRCAPRDRGRFVRTSYRLAVLIENRFQIPTEGLRKIPTRRQYQLELSGLEKALVSYSCCARDALAPSREPVSAVELEGGAGYSPRITSAPRRYGDDGAEFPATSSVSYLLH